MNLREAWVKWCVDLASSPDGHHFWSGARKIHENKVFYTRTLDDSLATAHLGYGNNKLAILQRQYFVEDAVNTAIRLHRSNVSRKKYASAAFHCYGHLIKSEKTSKRSSVMGPCIQSVVWTLRPHEKRTSVDVFYRTTEAFKKLPADFVWLRQSILPLIPEQDQYPVVGWRFHFVNVTIHPMYAPTIFPMLPDCLATLELWRARDPAFWHWTGKWLTRYCIGGAAGRSIERFEQAKRTASALRLLLHDDLPRLVQYLCDHREELLPRRTSFDLNEIRKAFDEAREKWTK